MKALVLAIVLGLGLGLAGPVSANTVIDPVTNVATCDVDNNRSKLDQFIIETNAKDGYEHLSIRADINDEVAAKAFATSAVGILGPHPRFDLPALTTSAVIIKDTAAGDEHGPAYRILFYRESCFIGSATVASSVLNQILGVAGLEPVATRQVATE